MISAHCRLAQGRQEAQDDRFGVDALRDPEKLAVQHDLGAVELLVGFIGQLVFTHLEVAAGVSIECVEATVDERSVFANDGLDDLFARSNELGKRFGRASINLASVGLGRAGRSCSQRAARTARGASRAGAPS
jgi:hypothetical protein